MAPLAHLKRPIDVLMVEDNPGDALLFKEVFLKSKFPIQLHVARNGIDALAFLHNEGGFSGAPRPDLILLDLNMPLKDGLAVLADIKQDPDLGQIPVLILTSSRNDQDRMGSYQLKANFYIVKPMELDQLEGIGSYLDEFWIKNIAAKLEMDGKR